MTLDFKSFNNEIDICAKYIASFKKRHPIRSLASDLVFLNTFAALCYLKEFSLQSQIFLLFCQKVLTSTRMATPMH